MNSKNENVCDKIKCNQSLDQRKEQLLSELEEVNKRIKEQQKECDLVYVLVGVDYIFIETLLTINV